MKKIKKVMATVLLLCMISSMLVVPAAASEITASEISLNYTGKTLAVGGSFELKAVFEPEGAAPTVTWTSDNSGVATVNEAGIVTGLTDGTAVITASVYEGQLTAECTVTVVTETTESPIVYASGVSLGEQTTLSLEPYGTATLVATVAPENATNKFVAWVSSDENVVTVDENGIVTAVTPGYATVSAIAADVDMSLPAEQLAMAAIANCAVTVSEPYVEPAPATVPVSGITISSKELVMTMGDAPVTLSAAVNSDATNQNVYWIIDIDTVASVEGGVISPLSAGSATIYAISEENGNIYETCTLTVNPAAPTTVPVSGITISSKELVMTMGDAPVTLSAAVNSDATNQNVYWTIDINTVASVEGGVITPLSAGSATIYAISEENGNIYETCTLTVNSGTVPVSGITISSKELVMTMGDAPVTLSAAVNSDATNQNVYWTIDIDTVASVEGGVISPLSAGSATIYAISEENGNIYETCTLTVNPAAPATVAAKSVTLEPNISEFSMKVGEYVDFTASVDAEATDKGIYWVSDDSAVASVDNGRVTANGSGRTTIYAVANGDTAYAACTVIVTAEPTAMFAPQPGAAPEGGEGGTEPQTESGSIVLTVGGTVWAEGRKIDLSTAENGTTYALNASMSDASEASYTWTLSGDGISLTPDTANSANCVLTVSGEGFGTITISNGTVSRIVDFTVSKQEITGLAAQLNLAVGETGTLTAGTKYQSNGITWTVESGSEFVSVDEYGKVTAGSAAGSAVVRATAKDNSGVYAECTVTVTSKLVSVSKVTLDKDTLNLKVGEEVTLNATVEPDDATNKNVSWSSSKTEVASVENGTVKAVAPGKTTITVTTADGSKTATCEVTVSAPPTVKIVCATAGWTELVFDIDEPNYTGLSAKLENGELDKNKDFKWEVIGNSGVVVLSANGENYKDCVIDMVGTGTVQIVASYDGIKSDPFRVTVQKIVKSISIPNEINLKPGESYNLGEEVQISPADPTTSALKWTSINGSNYISVNESTGVVTVSSQAPENVTATITAAATDLRKTTSNECRVKVISATVPVESITFEKAVASLTVGQTYKFVAKVNPANATVQSVKWVSTNPAVASVDPYSGLVTAKGNGTTQIQASADGKVVAVNLTVSVAPVNSGTMRIVASPQTISTVNGYSALTAYVNGYVIPTGVNWSVSDPNMATVSANGVVTAKRAGSFVVTGIYDNNNTRYSGTILITAAPVITSGNYSNYDGRNVMYFKTNQTYPSWRSTDIVSVDGVVLRHGQHCYVGSSTDGYVMVALNPQYLNTLPSSVVHTIRIGPSSAPAVGYFRTYTGQGTVINGVMTGDENQAALWAALCVMGILGCATILISRRKDWNS